MILISVTQHLRFISLQQVTVIVLFIPVLANDTTFATSYGRREIPFGTAGDCYSSQGHCPQVIYTCALAVKDLSKNTVYMLPALSRAIFKDHFIQCLSSCLSVSLEVTLYV